MGNPDKINVADPNEWIKWLRGAVTRAENFIVWTKKEMQEIHKNPDQYKLCGEDLFEWYKQELKWNKKEVENTLELYRKELYELK